jgi:osmoprotectant transport system substrate-binding protein
MRQLSPRRLLPGLAALVGSVALVACGSSSSSSSSSGASGGSSASLPGKGKPAVTIGDKNFTEEFILGQLYAQALEAKGYTVKLKPNIGGSEIIDKALTSGQIDMYPEYTGEIVLTIGGDTKAQPKSAQETYQRAKTFEESRGFTLLNVTPFYDTNEMAVKPAFAAQYHLTTIGDLIHVGDKGSKVVYGDTPENKGRYAGLVGLQKAYGLTNVQFKSLAIGLQYQAIEQGAVNMADVFSTDAQLQQTHLVILTDTKHIFGFQNVAPVVSRKVLSKEGPAFPQTLNAVSSKLTLEVMQKLNAAVALNKLDPAVVAKKFLQANGLA